MTTVQHELDRWRHELDRLAASDEWQLPERLLAETQHTIASYRTHILPLLIARTPCDAIVADELRHQVDRLEELRTGLYSGAVAPGEIAETLAALRALARVAARLEAS